MGDTRVSLIEAFAAGPVHNKRRLTSRARVLRHRRLLHLRSSMAYLRRVRRSLCLKRSAAGFRNVFPALSFAAFPSQRQSAMYITIEHATAL